jgi:hypothetical protein
MMRSRSRRRPARIGCLVVVLLLTGGLGFFVLRAHNGVTLSVGAHPTISAGVCSGAVLIQAGPANQVTLSGIFPQYTWESATSMLEITQCDEDMTITVPPHVDIALHAASAVTVIGVSGTLNLQTNGSRLTLERVTLEGGSKVSDNGGPIVFQGNLSRGSTPIISDNGGSIDMTLPARSSFHLALTGILGPLVANFPAVQAPADALSGLQVDVGSNPSAVHLTLDVNDTAVVLQGI